MAVDEQLADRVRAELAGRGVRWEERRMFGALVVMAEREIAVGVRGDGLLVRCWPEETETLAERPGASRARMGERTMSQGWLDVTGPLDDAALAEWVTVALSRRRAGAEQAGTDRAGRCSALTGPALSWR